MSPRAMRCVGLSVLVLLSIPIIYYTVKASLGYVNDPGLQPGDKLETRTCRQCGGSGKAPELAQEVPRMGDRCPFCRGKGKVEVLLPGPNRPTRFWGVVVDAERAEDPARGHVPGNLRIIATPFTPGKLTRIAGSIAGATVTFQPESGEPLTAKTDSSGRFSKRIPPGAYTLKVFAPGYGEVEKEIEVKPLQEPIWLEKANLVDEKDGPSVRGLRLYVGLPRPGEENGFMRITGG